jgi:glycogen operon protein
MSVSESAKQRLLSHIKEGFDVQRGAPMPLGATVKRGGINFAVFSRHATLVQLILFAPGEHDPILEFRLDPRYNKTGDVWHIFIQGLDPGIRYAYRMDRQPNEAPHIHRYNPQNILLDPHAKGISGSPEWGKIFLRKGEDFAGPHNRRRCVVLDDTFDWQQDQPLNTPLADTIIYEMHVRGFTRHPSARAKYPGTFKGVIEKIPYLKKLGVTAVELLPINEFEEVEGERYNPFTGERLLNYWGYNSIGFFAPKTSYAHKNKNDGPIREFKEMVKALHAAGIEVILDIVFNHTAEGQEEGPVYSFKGIDNSVYYIIDPITGEYHNYSGCGNTLNCNHPVVRDMIIECLRYWVTEMHVDGFRFDLASILGRGQKGEVLANPPLIERIAGDPILANTKLIAEAWDAAGLYQVGTFPAWGRWAEWNGKFRDDVRRFVKGDPGMVSALAARLSGSADLYEDDGREPFHSINFVTSHDGFTLRDLVSYNTKHNLANGENNLDGTDENFSWNCGVEGPTTNPAINQLRMRQMKNFAAILFLSHGVPMMLGGDELGRTQQGNNNAYCQDNEISWMNWTRTDESSELLRFFRLLIAFRKEHPNLRRASYDREHGAASPLLTWHGTQLNQPDWSYHSHSIALHLHSNPVDFDLFIICNAYWEPLGFQLPPTRVGRAWHRVVDTSLQTPDDIVETGEEILLGNQSEYNVHARSVVLLMAK